MLRKYITLRKLLEAALVFFALVALVYVYREFSYVDTGEMLDVSVSIKTVSHVSIDNVGDSVWNYGSGSGFLVSVDRCEIWTNEHVIKDAAIIEVFPRDWSSPTGIPATVTGATPRADVAVLQLERCEGIREATLGDSDKVEIADDAYAIGNPLGRNPDSVSRGIISHAQRYLAGATPYLQTDAVIHKGNSGGALFNRHAEVIGINTAVAIDGNVLGVGIGYAMPINFVKQIARQVVGGTLSWGDAGIEDIVSGLTPDNARIFGVPKGHGGLMITRTPEQGPSAGKLFQHDVVYGIDGTAVTSVAQAMNLIGDHAPGDSIAVELFRQGSVHTERITLGDGKTTSPLRQADYYEGYLGMTVEMWNADSTDQLPLQSPVITKVHSLGPAHNARIASSQKTVGRSGPLVFPIVLDVKTVTGVAFDKSYYPIDSIAELDRLAAEAFRAQQPLLLEIEVWSRANPMDYETPPKYLGTSFHRVQPAQSTVALPGADSELVTSVESLPDTNAVGKSHTNETNTSLNPLQESAEGVFGA